jgi:hypothetical protein
VDDRDEAMQKFVDRSHQLTVERQRARDRIRGQLGERAAQAFDQEVQYRAGSGAARTWAHQRAAAAQATWDRLLDDDVEGAWVHLQEAFRKDRAVAMAEMARGRYPMQAPIEEAAKKLGMDPDAARAAWMRQPEFADLFIEVGRVMERAHNSGRRREPENMLADLALAAKAEREQTTIYKLVKHLPSEREAKQRLQGAKTARAALQGWIAAG